MKYFFIISTLCSLTLSACKDGRTTKLLYQGHASFRLVAKNGTVIYIDPAFGEGYDLPADIILITHAHSDHNIIDLVPQKENCVIITHSESLKGGNHNTFTIKDINIEAVEANNRNHNPEVSVGYIITVDGIKLYHAGDTSKTVQMETFPEKKLDYALLPCDGNFNMDTKQAAECAEIIGARHNIPIHTGPFKSNGPVLFDKEIAERVNAPNRLIVEPGVELELTKL